MKKLITLLMLTAFLFPVNSNAQHSIARQWNEQLLEAIRGDLARPTVHARNLFHISVAMYDAWAIYGQSAETYLLGKTVHGYHCPLNVFNIPEDIQAAQKEAISYAVYRIINHRFVDAPSAEDIFEHIDEFMEELGYPTSITSTDYACGPAQMGNYIAQHIINFGMQDGANEENRYENQFYEPINKPLFANSSSLPDLTDYNRWQPLQFSVFVDQSGNPVSDGVPLFLSAEWGQVLPFSLQEEDLNIYERDGDNYWVYHDPGPPPYLSLDSVGGLSEEYKWGFGLVSAWSAHLDPKDEVIWDISPASTGNIQEYPTTVEGLRDFYNLEEGGDYGLGHDLNPKTGQAYEPQLVPRGDYARVLAEFWADGPDSETPPGHWFTILNQVNDHPDLEKKFKGEGAVLSDLEWDVKSYFALGGAMHDAAISAWGIKGWYDYIRPISAIRAMALLGQSSDSNLPNYHPGGIPLIPGFIELVQEGDTLSTAVPGDIKLLAWKGHQYIQNPFNDVAEVGWILSTSWMPYQRLSFVTPPFAGYVSGHSTFSRAAAEVLTAFTGDSYFPGGVGEFNCPQNEFLVFEDGPSINLTLQWATYRDASDQCSLSRIWGGIHPPADDIPGRLIGLEVGLDAFAFAEQYFTKQATPIDDPLELKIYPNPTDCTVQIEYNYDGILPINVYQSNGAKVRSINANFSNRGIAINLDGLPSGLYFIEAHDEDGNRIFGKKVTKE